MLSFRKLGAFLAVILGLVLSSQSEYVLASEQETQQPSPQDMHEAHIKRDTASSPEYLALVLKLGSCSSCISIKKANQVAGRLIVRDVRGSFIYEVTKNGKSVFVGTLPDDPFVVRGFSFPSKQGESVSKSESATVSMYIPNVDLNAAVEGKLELKIYQVKRGFGIEHASVDELSQLKEKNMVSLEWHLSQTDLANQAKRATK
jgi:hypothetical protein